MAKKGLTFLRPKHSGSESRCFLKFAWVCKGCFILHTCVWYGPHAYNFVPLVTGWYPQRAGWQAGRFGRFAIRDSGMAILRVPAAFGAARVLSLPLITVEVAALEVFLGSIAKGSSSKSGCKLHLPTSHANLPRSHFTCQVLMPTFR